MTERERLIEMCENFILSCKASLCEDCEHIQIDYPHCMGVHFADHLLSNGVIVPPCKVGDVVWFDTYKKSGTVSFGIQPHKVDRIDVICVVGEKELVETKLHDWYFGDSVFLAKEEAEKALKERSEGK